MAVPYETEPWRVLATSRSCQRWHRATLSPKQTQRTQSSASEDTSGCGVPDRGTLETVHLQNISKNYLTRCFSGWMQGTCFFHWVNHTVGETTKSMQLVSNTERLKITPWRLSSSGFNILPWCCAFTLSISRAILKTQDSIAVIITLSVCAMTLFCLLDFLS